jgi:hypothetical protein
MIVFLVGLATVSALVSCDVLRTLQPDKTLPRVLVAITAALLAIVSISAVVQLVQLARLV